MLLCVCVLLTLEMYSVVIQAAKIAKNKKKKKNLEKFQRFYGLKSEAAAIMD